MTDPCKKCIHVITCEAYGRSCRKREAYDRWKKKAADMRGEQNEYTSK